MAEIILLCKTVIKSGPTDLISTVEMCYSVQLRVTFKAANPNPILYKKIYTIANVMLTDVLWILIKQLRIERKKKDKFDIENNKLILFLFYTFLFYP